LSKFEFSCYIFPASISTRGDINFFIPKVIDAYPERVSRFDLSLWEALIVDVEKRIYNKNIIKDRVGSSNKIHVDLWKLG
jgi:hypothetical protein